jgi:hypothetical protein
MSDWEPVKKHRRGERSPLQRQFRWLHSSRERISSRTRLDWFANFRLASNCRPRICRCAYRRRLIGDLLPFIQAAQNGPFDRADMNEHIGAAGVGLDGPEAFRRIEPSHCARRHVALSNRPTNLAEPLFIARHGRRQSALWLLSGGGRPRVYQAMTR